MRSARETSRGTLLAGKLADLIVLDRNPLTIDIDALTEIAVDEVVLGGEQVRIDHPSGAGPYWGCDCDADVPARGGDAAR
ncbi:amidohydrolase family protein [Mycolicibacterium baixiangningiae]|uniref:amidohydrolase family protein n=1 Tax=Mycolicibacterium baixiangningiae TaxID=2761578 RepID=UPI0018669217